MRLGIRLGPISLSSRVGGRRGRGRKKSKPSASEDYVGCFVFVFVVVGGAIAAVIKYPYVGVPALVAMGALVVWLVKVVRKGQRKAEREALDAERRWLAGPPPTLMVPGRFSDAWFATYVPRLHPGQVPALFDELRERGWSEDKLAVRVEPYIELNPYLARAVAPAAEVSTSPADVLSVVSPQMVGPTPEELQLAARERAWLTGGRFESRSLSRQLKELAELRDNRDISPSEYEQLKADLITESGPEPA